MRCHYDNALTRVRRNEMAAAFAGQVYLVTLNGLLANQRTMNTFTYVVENVPAGGADQIAVYAALETFFELPAGIINKFLDCCPDNYLLENMTIQAIGPGDRLVKTTALQALNGTFGFAAETANVAGVITRTTEKAGRSQVSSLHIPVGASSDWMANGVMIPGWITAASALCLLLDDQIGVVPNLTLDPVIAHGVEVGDPVPDQIIKAVPQTTARVMRRRTVGLGI